MGVIYKCGVCYGILIYDQAWDHYKCLPCITTYAAQFINKLLKDGYVVRDNVTRESPALAVSGLDPLTQQPDCKDCGGSWYDHIGFRGHLEGEAQSRTSCRIAHCRCLEYVPCVFGTPSNRHREES